MTVVFLALALAADAFAAALIQGATARGQVRPVALSCAVAFGVAQAVMPLVGWGLSRSFSATLAAVDHWIAFAVLAVLGVKLIKEGLTRGTEDEIPVGPTVGLALVALAVATSLDAAAAGLTFDAMAIAPVVAAAVIGGITAAVSAGGVVLGQRVGPALGGRAEVLGGLALIAIGLKVLVDHGAITTA